jgi:hypothetical protein
MAPTGCLLGAFNEDGLTDVLVYFWGRSPIIYLQQPAAAGGERLTAQSFIPCELIEPWQRWFSCAATQADLDGDGHCDLVIGNYCADGGDYLDPNGTGQLTMTESLSRTRPGLPGLASRCRRVRFRGRSYRYGPWNADTVKDSDAPHSARWYAGMPPVPIEMDSIVLEELNREGPPWAER